MKKKKSPPNRKVGSAGVTTAVAETAAIKEMRSLINRMAPVMRRAEAIGTFTGERDLLGCPECGLIEDLDINGRLFTYVEGCQIKDSGFRFAPAGAGTWICAVCGTVVIDDTPFGSHDN